MTRSQAVSAATSIMKRYAHLKAEPYEQTIQGGWAVEITQRKPWRMELQTQDEVADLLHRRDEAWDDPDNPPDVGHEGSND